MTTNPREARYVDARDMTDDDLARLEGNLVGRIYHPGYGITQELKEVYIRRRVEVRVEMERRMNPENSP